MIIASLDVQTLSRMTGKDFSGPTPEIRAPTPVRLDIVSNDSEGQGQGSRSNESAKKRVTKKAPSVVEENVEVLGNLSDLDDDEELDGVEHEDEEEPTAGVGDRGNITKSDGQNGLIGRALDQYSFGTRGGP